MDPELASFLEGVLGATFLLAAAAKTLSRVSLSPFLVDIGVGPRAARLAAPLVAPAEALLGVLLVLGYADLPVASVSLGLALAFVAAQTRATTRRLAHGCRCFGALDVESRLLAAARAALAAVLAGGVLTLAATGAASGSLVTGTASRPLALGAASGIAMGLALALVAQVVRFEQRRPRVNRLRATVVER